METVAQRVSVDLDAFYQTRQSGDASERGVLLVLSCDGKGMVMRKEGLREATRKAAEVATHKKQTRLSKVERRNRKRMATVAAVYDVAPHVRSPESILGETERKGDPPKPQNKRVWASVEKPSLEVIEAMFEEALRRDPEQKRKWVILVDGQLTQLQEIHRTKKKLGVQAEVVVDFVHVLEYLWKAAYCFHAEESPTAEAWVKDRALKVLRGKASHVAAGIRRSATKQELSIKERKNADKCCDYLLKNKEYLRYGKALRKGYPIATGVIEGACRYLVKDRMDITGARWGLKGAEAILKIRALVTSGDFEDYFAFHKHQERMRNYPFYEAISFKMAA
ncbi:MAG: ISKra4 family transposase [Fibrobacterota bacterium]|nr:ISKra4 family transposase [Fibrobacterota bacterium]